MSLKTNIPILIKNKIPRSHTIGSGSNNLLLLIPRKSKISGHFGLNKPHINKIQKTLSINN
jgi:hypothetical protein